MLDKKELYKCNACGMYYKTEDLAKRCEAFCKKHHACDTTIIKHAVKI